MRDCSLFEVAWLAMISEQLGWVQFEYNMRLMGRVRYLVWSEMRILMGTRNELYGYRRVALTAIIYPERGWLWIMDTRKMQDWWH